MKRALLFALTAILLIMVVSACSSNKAPDVSKTSSQPAPAPVTGNSTTGKATADAPQKAQVAATEETEPAEEAEPADDPTEEAAPADEPADDEGFTLDSRETGLDKLKSYRMKWMAEWSGVDNGKEEKGAWNWIEEYSSDPKSLHWVWDYSDPADASKSGKMEWWQIGDVTYMKMSEDECISMSSEDTKNQFDKGLFNPDMLGKVDNAQYVGDETINGIRAKHYKYDENAANLSSFGSVSGEIWVAIDGGYVVKDVVNWKGGAGLFGAAGGNTGTKGEGKWTWELSDVDKPLTINAPENCGGAANDLPIMADAAEKSTFGDMVIYKTTAEIADVVAFYDKEMAAAGWEKQDDGMTSEEMASLNFKKDEQTAQVMITRDDDKTQVMITVSK